MANIWQFISSHWRVILEASLVVILFVLQLFKKKPINLIDGVKTVIYENICSCINSAEKLGISGSEKKKYVHELICSAIGSWFGVQPRKVDDIYKDYIDDVIEEVLTTPQKKGGE